MTCQSEGGRPAPPCLPRGRSACLQHNRGEPSPLSPRRGSEPPPSPPRSTHRARCCGARRRPTSTCPRRSRQAARTGSGRLGRGLLAACGATGPRSERSAPPAALRGLKVGEKARRAKEKPPRCSVQGKFVRGAGCVRTKCMLPRRRRHAGGATGEKYYVGLFIGRCLPFLRTFDQSYKTVFSKEGSRILTFFVCSILAES